MVFENFRKTKEVSHLDFSRRVGNTVPAKYFYNFAMILWQSPKNRLNFSKDGQQQHHCMLIQTIVMHLVCNENDAKTLTLIDKSNCKLRKPKVAINTCQI